MVHQSSLSISSMISLLSSSRHYHHSFIVLLIVFTLVTNIHARSYNQYESMDSSTSSSSSSSSHLLFSPSVLNDNNMLSWFSVVMNHITMIGSQITPTRQP